MSNVLLGLGSNVDAEQNMRTTARMLRKHWPDIRFSHVYRTAPQELEDQAEFLNAVARMETEREPQEILTILSMIEQALGKAPLVRFGPRTIDLDLLLVGNRQIPSGPIVLPHPRMHRRRFVLEPLSELLNADWKHPVVSKTAKELLEEVQSQSCEITDIVLN